MTDLPARAPSPVLPRPSAPSRKPCHPASPPGGVVGKATRPASARPLPASHLPLPPSAASLNPAPSATPLPAPGHARNKAPATHRASPASGHPTHLPRPPLPPRPAVRTPSPSATLRRAAGHTPRKDRPTHRARHAPIHLAPASPASRHPIPGQGAFRPAVADTCTPARTGRRKLHPRAARRTASALLSARPVPARSAPCPPSPTTLCLDLPGRNPDHPQDTHKRLTTRTQTPPPFPRTAALHTPHRKPAARLRPASSLAVMSPPAPCLSVCTPAGPPVTGHPARRYPATVPPSPVPA